MTNSYLLIEFYRALRNADMTSQLTLRATKIRKIV